MLGSRWPCAFSHRDGRERGLIFVRQKLALLVPVALFPSAAINGEIAGCIRIERWKSVSGRCEVLSLSIMNGLY